jgi:hypothetical protein
MARHKVTLRANQGIFRGLAKQNMLFHQCVSELIDNAIAAQREDHKFRIEVFLNRDEEDYNVVNVYVVDDCQGMTLDVFKRALQLGESAMTESRLNEHGFGMKNALATLSKDNGFWKIWTRPIGEKTVYSAEGPFGPEMVIKDDESFPDEDFLPTDLSTVVFVPVRLQFIQTVQGRGAPAKDLASLRAWLIEHLGVLYRGYLVLDDNTGETSGAIYVSISRERLRVPPVVVPLGSIQTRYLEVEIGGEVVPLTYKYGTLDEVRRDRLIHGEKAKFYYQGNTTTQGIDIRLGKRVIATKQFETIWKHEDGKRQLTRHNMFNDFLGELLIPELPRGILTTVNSKTDFNLDDPDWVKIFGIIDEIRPLENIREKTEAGLRDKWIRMLQATNPEDIVTDERTVWPTGTRIDVYRKTAEGRIVIYELKAGSGHPIHLYQLRMYWDGLVLYENESPREAILLVEDFDANLEEMANALNALPPPPGSEPYDFRIEKHEDKGI